MSNGAAKSIGIIVNVVTIGVVTLTLGIWVSRVAKEQQTLANRLSVIESNQKKIAESINDKLKTNSSNESEVRRLAQTIATLKSDQNKFRVESEDRSDRVNASLSEELKALERNIQSGQDSLKAELLRIVREELKKPANSIAEELPEDSEDSSHSSEDEGVIDSIKSLSDKSFLELYELPPERGRSKGFFVTDNGEAFYVDRANNAVVSAWDTVHKNEFKDYIRDLLAKLYRHRKEELEKAILAELPTDFVAELQATNLSKPGELKLHSIEGTPTYSESSCRLKVVVSLGAVMKPVTIGLPYRNLPGVVALTPTTSTPASTTVANTSSKPSLSDTEIIDAIRKVSNSSSAITEAFLFPKPSAKQGVVYAFASGSGSQLFVIDSAKDLVLPINNFGFNTSNAASSYRADYNLVLRETVQDAIDHHRDAIYRFFLNEHANTAAELEKQVLSGSAKAEVTDVKIQFPDNNDFFPREVRVKVTIQAGSLVRQMSSSIGCTELPNMRSISR